MHAKLVEAQQKSNKGIPVANKPWKLGEYLDYWLENVVRPAKRWNTYKKYEQTVRLYLKPCLGTQELWDRAVSRGEVQSEIDPDLALDLMFGPAMWRLVSGRRPMTDDEADTIVDSVLNGLGVTSP